VRISAVTPVFVDTIPDCLKDGILYVCERYWTVAHRCCCGCGQEVITPLTPVDWSVRKEGKVISLTPSIGNWSFACKSHYWIYRNQVVWANQLSPQRINEVKARDKADKEVYIEAINQKKERQARPVSMLAKFWQALIRWWK
jgi:hypothetical protein